MASWEKLPSGRYRGVYRDSAGDKKHPPGTFRLQSEAFDAAKDAEAIARRQASLANGTLSANITWNAWWEVFNATRTFESDSADVEKSIVKKHISPRWGGTAVKSISKNAVQTWVDELQRQKTPHGKRYEPSYVRTIYGLFSVSINGLLNADPPVLTASPLVGIKMPPLRKKQKPHIPTADVPALTTELRDDYADALEWILETGCRPNEVCGLHDDQVDLATRTLVVRTVYLHRSKRMRDYPKDKDVRSVPLTQLAVDIYSRRTADRNMSAPCGVEHYGASCCHDVVFRTDLGRVMKPQKLREAFIRAATAAGLTPRSPYAGRRGFATRLARAGIDLFELMEIMGWSDPKLAAEYVQESVGARERLLAALDDPEAVKLRVVGSQSDRGTDHGTGGAPQPPAQARKQGRRKSG